MTKVTIDRELLERELLSVLDFSESNLRRVVDHLIDVGYTRAAQRQPEGDNSGNPNLRDGLEVVAYIPVDRATGEQWHPVKAKGTGAICDYIQLIRLSDAQCVIAERDATIERLEAGVPRLQEQSHQMRKQRDKLAGLLRDERNWNCVEISCQRGVKGHCICGTCRVLRVDAALAEVKACTESPHPAAT